MNDQVLVAAPPTPAVEVTPPRADLALIALISRAATDPAVDIGKLQALLEVKKQWEADEARKAFAVAFTAFKAEGAQIMKNKLITDGPLRGKRYADLFAVVDTLIPVLVKHGLSHSWSIVRDEKDWIEVACILTHAQGHAERRTMGGPPDNGGAKNAIQARASSVSYLERYTFLAVVGMAASDQDTDGVPPPAEEKPDPWTPALKREANDARNAGKYAAWWKKQSPEFRDAAVGTKQHADFKAAE
jgi:hypothetical protein